MAPAAPMMATEASAVGARWKSTLERAIRYTPAVTMVAAWISALTGVGPSMASGSHVYSGICADFATAPMSNMKQMVFRMPVSGLMNCALPKTPS